MLLQAAVYLQDGAGSDDGVEGGEVGVGQDGRRRWW